MTSVSDKKPRASRSGEFLAMVLIFSLCVTLAHAITDGPTRARLSVYCPSLFEVHGPQRWVAPEATTAYAWMRRTQTTPLRNWYFASPSSASEAVPGSYALDDNVYREGRVLFPLHLMYLYAAGRYVSAVAGAGKEGGSVWGSFEPTADHVSKVRDAHVASLSWVLALLIAVAGVPVVWRLCDGVLGHLLQAAEDRRQATPQAGAGALPGRWRRTLIVLAACVLAHLLCLLPLLVLEITTAYPVATGAVALLWVVFLLFSDEEERHDGGRLVDANGKPRLELFDFENPITTQTGILFCPLKKEQGGAKLCGALLLTVALALTLPVFLPVVPIVGLWTAAACLQRSRRRVLVCAKDDKKAGGYSFMGFSDYADRTYLSGFFGITAAPASLLAFAVTLPFWYGTEGSPFDLLHLLARPPAPAGPLPSVTGAAQLTASCLAATELSYYGCQRPAPNLWLMAEHFFLPLTELMRRVAAVVQDEVRAETLLFSLDYMAIVTGVFINVFGCGALVVYRMRIAPVVFDKPEALARAVAEQKKEIDFYWRTHMGPQAARVAHENKDRIKKEAAKKGKGGRTLTSLTADEYIVKQLLVLSWLFLVAFASFMLIAPRVPTPLYVAPLLAPAALLGTVHVLVGVVGTLYRAALSTDAADSAQQKAETVVMGSSVWRSRTSRWFRLCSSLSETPDFLFVAATVAGVVGVTMQVLLFCPALPLCAAFWLGVLVLEAVRTRALLRIDVAWVFLYGIPVAALSWLVAGSLRRGATLAEVGTSYLNAPLWSAGSFDDLAARFVNISGVVTALLIGLLVHGTMRLLKLMMEREELRIRPVGEEMALFEAKKEK